MKFYSIDCSSHWYKELASGIRTRYTTFGCPLRVGSGPSLSYQSNGRFRSEAEVKNAANQDSEGPESATSGSSVFPTLLVDLTIVLDPPGYVAALWISVCPVNDTPFVVPLIFATESHCVALPERRDSRGKIDIVSHKQSLTSIQSYNEPLVAASVVIVRQDSYDYSFTLCLLPATPLFVLNGRCAISAAHMYCRRIIGVKLTPPDIGGDEKSY